jgi:cytochrome c biogenesis protein CcmG/thiol:disulfide interchange protein DsbE
MQPTPTTGKPASPIRGRGLVIAPLVIFAALVLMLLFALHKGDPSRLPSALIGKPAPALDLPPLAGMTGPGGQPLPGITASELRGGHVSLVNFWASWCAPCVDEQPLLVSLAERTGVAMYGVNYKDQAVNARRFLGRYGNPFRAVGIDADGRAAIEWGVYGMPETFVIDGRGVIVYKHIGPLSPETIESKLIPAIRAASSAR